MIAKNANLSQKEEFLQVIQEVLEGLVRDGIDRKAWRQDQLSRVPVPGGGFRRLSQG